MLKWKRQNTHVNKQIIEEIVAGGGTYVRGYDMK